jgi:hypothetical protein
MKISVSASYDFKEAPGENGMENNILCYNGLISEQAITLYSC